ncbi:MAG: ribosome biogenesis GTPase Der [Chlorobiaceae bacterium]|nr:ribosome biogenesis GTPase Der [Chlorobiaceae bacterium]MBA4308979.1 ribosome biogenesis GTPase Der [Chlorobiaceae bacterium]
MKTPLVVIVGRPNVGKSTLFNRLIGHKEAIVDDQSGVTRDRNYGEADWNNKKYRLIDTGGYVPNSKELFETAIREQVDLAIEEADVILFVVDSRAGITPVDVAIAKKLRNSNKKFFLLANKIDSHNTDQLVYEFHSLGVGEPFAVSGMVGRGLGDFLDLLTGEFPEITNYDEDKRLKIAIVGRPNVGKSSLTNALLGYDRSIVTDIPGTTRDSVDSVLRYHGEEIILIDTAGLRKKSKIDGGIEFYSTVRTLRAIGECDVAIILLDSILGLENQDQKIIDEAVQRRKGIILAVNKWDLVDKDTHTAKIYTDQLNSKLGNLDYLPITFVSALTKQRIFKLIEQAKEIEAERKKRIPTSELNEFLQEEISKLPPPSTHTGREVKIKYMTQVGEKYPVFLFFTNYPKSVNDNYKRYLEKAIRKRFGYFGVPFTMSFKEK